MVKVIIVCDPLAAPALEHSHLSVDSVHAGTWPSPQPRFKVNSLLTISRKESFDVVEESASDPVVNGTTSIDRPLEIPCHRSHFESKIIHVR